MLAVRYRRQTTSLVAVLILFTGCMVDARACVADKSAGTAHFITALETTKEQITLGYECQEYTGMGTLISSRSRLGELLLYAGVGPNQAILDLDALDEKLREAAKETPFGAYLFLSQRHDAIDMCTQKSAALSRKAITEMAKMRLADCKGE